MPVKYVLHDLFGNHTGISPQSGVELITILCGNLVAYMYKLTEIWVVERIVTGRKYRIELSPNYFLYLIAVPISLTVTVLIPQMQFMS